MWGPFNCPHCHKLVRVRRNYVMRIIRLVVITAILFCVFVQVSEWVGDHAKLVICISAGTVGMLDEYITRLLPAEIEPAGPGGFAAMR